MDCKLCKNELDQTGTHDKYTMAAIIEIGEYVCNECGRFFEYPTGNKETFNNKE